MLEPYAMKVCTYDLNSYKLRSIKKIFWKLNGDIFIEKKNNIDQEELE